MLSMSKNEQELKLVNGGLTSQYNAPIAKLLLTKHGYTDNPQANQADTGIQVTVNRGSVTLKSGGQTLQVSTEQDTGPAERVIEHGSSEDK